MAQFSARLGQTYVVSSDGNDTHAGSTEQPWATIHHAALTAQPGDTVYIREGAYAITEPIRPARSGDANAPIVYAAYPGEQPVIDAYGMDPRGDRQLFPFRTDTGAFHLQQVAHIRLHGIKVANSRAQGIAIRDSSHIDIVNCTVENTFSCGISVWDTDSDALHSRFNRIVGNTVIKANTWDMIPDGMQRGHEPPHEAISIAGGADFEVAYNHVHHCDKEGIDVKEVSRRGRVHHNYVHHCDRQGLYADAWFGLLTDVEFDHNVVHHCHGAGFAISVEGKGSELENIRFHHNLLYANDGTGILFGRWGNDLPRRSIRIHHNTVVGNGRGVPGEGQPFFWITGGLYLFSANLDDVDIRNNIFSDNVNFEIGYSDLYTADGAAIEAVLAQKNIRIKDNLIHNASRHEYPIRAGWGEFYCDIRPCDGDAAVSEQPVFADEESLDFRLRQPSGDWGIGGANGQSADRWWAEAFPPKYGLDGERITD